MKTPVLCWSALAVVCVSGFLHADIRIPPQQQPKPQPNAKVAAGLEVRRSNQNVTRIVIPERVLRQLQANAAGARRQQTPVWGQPQTWIAGLLLSAAIAWGGLLLIRRKQANFGRVAIAGAALALLAVGWGASNLVANAPPPRNFRDQPQLVLPQVVIETSRLGDKVLIYPGKTFPQPRAGAAPQNILPNAPAGAAPPAIRTPR